MVNSFTKNLVVRRTTRPEFLVVLAYFLVAEDPRRLEFCYSDVVRVWYEHALVVRGLPMDHSYNHITGTVMNHGGPTCSLFHLYLSRFSTSKQSLIPDSKVCLSYVINHLTIKTISVYIKGALV